MGKNSLFATISKFMYYINGKKRVNIQKYNKSLEV